MACPSPQNINSPDYLTKLDTSKTPGQISLEISFTVIFK